MAKKERHQAVGSQCCPAGSGAETLEVGRDREATVISSTFELRLSQPGRDTLVLPIRRSVTRLGPEPIHDICFAGAPSLIFGLLNATLHVSNLTPQVAVEFPLQPCEPETLRVGESLRFGETQVLFWDRAATCYLEGSSPPLMGRVWPLQPGLVRGGRSGVRPNEICIENPTLSRAQATLAVSENRCEILAESQVNPVTLNGHQIDAGQRRLLNDGDLIEFGSLAFYLRNVSAVGAPKLNFTFLGSFSLSISGEGQPIADSAWKSKPVKWLMALLAYEWGKPVSNERLIHTIWEDLDLVKGRHRLNASCSTIRQVLKQLGGEPTLSSSIWRSSTAVQLSPAVLGSSDLHELRDLLEASQSLRRQGYLAQSQAIYCQAVVLAQRPFLEGCELEWALAVRCMLEQQVCEVGRNLVECQLAASDYEGAQQVAALVLKLDAYCQASILNSVRALRHLGRSADALKAFEAGSQRLMQDLDLEPDGSLLEEVQKIPQEPKNRNGP